MMIVESHAGLLRIFSTISAALRSPAKMAAYPGCSSSRPSGFQNTTEGSVLASMARELILVFEMLGPSGGIAAVCGEIRERLMMILKRTVRMAADRVGPAPRVPGPADAFLRE